MSACAACLIATTEAHFVFAPFLLQMLRREMQLRLTGRLHLRRRSLQTPVTKELHLSDLQRVQLPLQSLHAWQHGLLQPGNCHGSTTHLGVPDNHYSTTA